MGIYSSSSNQVLTTTSTPKFNNVTSGLSIVATAAGTTTLTAASNGNILFTGSTTQTLVLPVVSTLNLGTTYHITNRSSGAVTVQSSGLNDIQVMAANTYMMVTCISLSGTGVASWDAIYEQDGTGVISATGTANQVLVNGTSGAATSGAVTLTLPQSIATSSSPVFNAVTGTNGVISGATSGSTSNYLRTYSLTASSGSISLQSADNTADHQSILTNIPATGARTWSLPDASGTIALTSNVPSIGNFSFVGNIMSTSTNEDIIIQPNGSSNSIILNGSGNLSANTGAQVEFIAQDASAHWAQISYSNGVAGKSNLYNMYKSRASLINTFSALSNGDDLGAFQFYGDDGSAFVKSAGISATVSGSVSTGVVPGQLQVSTTNTSGVSTVAMTISNAQVVTLANALPVGSGGLGSTSTPSNGQIPIGNGSNYAAANITAGSGISITNGSGSITIAATSSAPSWVGISGTTQAASAGFGYVVQNASQTTITLPATAALGDIVTVQGLGAGGWVLAANTGQTIQVGAVATSSGGTVTSNDQWDSIQVVCVVADTTWAVTYLLSYGVTTA